MLELTQPRYSSVVLQLTQSICSEPSLFIANPVML